MSHRSLRGWGLLWVGLVAACGSPPPECPPGFRMESEVCVAAGGRLEGVARAEGSLSGSAGIQVAVLGTDRVATTETSGVWAMEGLPSGEYTLRFSFDGYVPEELERVAVSAAGATPVDAVTLHRRAQGARVLGVVTAPGGASVEGALAYLERTAHVAFVDPDGAFALGPVPVGEYRLVVRHDGYLRLTQPIAVTPEDETIIAEPLELAPAPGAAGPTGRVTGRVTLGGSAGGNAGVQVYLAGTGHVAFTADDGSFRLDGVPAGAYALRAVAPGWLAGAIPEVTVQVDETTDVGVLELAPADDRRSGAVNGRVGRFGLADGAGTRVRIVGDTGVVAETITAADGGYQFEAVPEGVYRLDFDHPPWQPLTVEPVVVAEGSYRMPDATLYLGRQVDDRPLVDAAVLSGERVLLRLRTDGEPASVLYDGATGVRVPLPDGDFTALADRADRDHVLLLSVREVADTAVRHLVDVDLSAGEARELPNAGWPRGYGDGVLYRDAEQRVWDQPLDGTAPRLAAAPPCPGATLDYLGSGVGVGHPHIIWQTGSCGGPSSLYQFYDPSRGTVGSLLTTGPGGTGLTSGLFVANDDPTQWGPFRLVRVDFVEGTESEVLTGVTGLWRTETGTIVQHDADPVTGRGTLSWVTPEGAVKQLLTDAEFVAATGGRLALRKGEAGDLWMAPLDTLVPFRVCLAPSSYRVTETRTICSEGAADPHRLIVVDLTSRATTVLSTNAQAVNVPSWGSEPVVVRWQDAVTGTWYARRSDASDSQALCDGALSSPALSSDKSWMGYVCATASGRTLRMRSLTSGETWDALPTATNLPDYVDIRLEPRGRGLVASYQLTTTGTTAADCGGSICLLAYSAITGQRHLQPVTSTYLQAPTWSAEAEAVAVTASASFQFRFGPAALATRFAELGSPVGVGPGGRYALWHKYGERSLSDMESGSTSPVSAAASTYCLASGRWCTAGDQSVSLVSGQTFARGSDASYPRYTTDRSAATWVTSEGGGGAFMRMDDTGPQYLAYAASLLDSNYVWLGYGERGSLGWRDPDTGLLHEVVADALRPEAPVDWGRWLVRGALVPESDWGDLVLAEADGTVTRVGAAATLTDPLWPDASAADRVAFNGWTPDGVRLMAVDLEGGAPTVVGLPATDVRFTEEARIAFASDGIWFQETQQGAVPVDRSEHLGGATLSTDGRRVVYGVDGATWPDLARRGTWLASVP